MAEPSQGAIQEQIKQAQQSAWPQASPPSQPLHPMAAGANQSPPPSPPTLPIPSIGQPGGAKKKGIMVTMSKLSLLTLAFSLMFLGALTFLGGFFVGIWFASPSSTNPQVSMNMTTPLQDFSQQQTFAPPPYVESQAPSAFSTQAGHAAQASASNVSVPNVPSFLNPLVSATQSAISQQIGHSVQQGLGQKTSQQAPAPNLIAPSKAIPHPTSSSAVHKISPPSHTGSTQNQSNPPSLVSKEPGSPSSENGGLYTVQLGVYASPDNANALISHLQSLNLLSYLTESKAENGSLLYHVHSGHFKDYNMAVKAAARFGEYHIPGATVVQISQSDKSTT